MKVVDREYVLFAIAGGAAGLLQQPFFSDNIPEVYVIVPGIIFSLSITIAAMFLAHENFPRSAWVKRYLLGAIVLAVGMPVALFGGAVSLMPINRIIPGDRFQLGGVGLSFLFCAIVSCVLWSFAMAIWVAIVNRSKAFAVLRTALAVTVSILIFASLVEMITKSLWQKSFFFPVVSLGEVIGSALVLAIGCSTYFVHHWKSVTQP